VARGLYKEPAGNHADWTHPWCPACFVHARRVMKKLALVIMIRAGQRPAVLFPVKEMK
jgi:hypothetical protein